MKLTVSEFTALVRKANDLARQVEQVEVIAELPCEFCKDGKRTVTVHGENGDMDGDDQICSFCGGTGLEPGDETKAGIISEEAKTITK